uniref:Secreted protein n=1 Tax=Romanomermis culicivorax TaxID=13658 RepID=A0A915IHR3_ROMCU
MVAIPPTRAATHTARAPFTLTAMMILATPMDTIMNATAAMTTINPTPRLILVTVAATDQQLLYSNTHMQPTLGPHSKTARLVLPPYAPTFFICPFPPPLPRNCFVAAVTVVAGLTLPSAWPPMLVRSSIAVQME